MPLLQILTINSSTIYQEIMKILQINKYPYIKGGADVVFFQTLNLLKHHGHEVYTLTINDPKSIIKENAFYANYLEIRENSFLGKIKSVPSFFYNKSAANELEKLIIKEKPDIAQIHLLFNGISLSILPVLKKYKIPVIYTVHDTRLLCPSSSIWLKGQLCNNCYKRRFINCFNHKCYQNSRINSFMTMLEMIHKEFIFNYFKFIDKYIFISNNYMQFHKKSRIHFSKRSVVLYNFYPKLNSILPNKNKGNYLFYYGRITKEKGIQTLVDVMTKFKNVTLKIAGTGPLLEKLKKEASHNIEFLGFISGAELFYTVEHSSFVIVPSEGYENNPLTIIEAYSYGKPVIGANIGGIPEIINEGKTGYLFNSGDKTSLENAIKKALINTEAEYKILSQNSRKFAETNFSPDNYYTKLISIYKQTIAEYENI